MSLATRCPVCQTVFRVVQDQLKVSEGWVRCGRCTKVFNAFEGLFDLEREFPALRQPTPSQRVLEDLATRNRQPKTPSQWDNLDDDATRVPTRAAGPTPATPPRTAAPPTPAPPATMPTMPAVARQTPTPAAHAAPRPAPVAPRPVPAAVPAPTPATAAQPTIVAPRPAVAPAIAPPATAAPDATRAPAPRTPPPVQAVEDDGATLPRVAAGGRPGALAEAGPMESPPAAAAPTPSLSPALLPSLSATAAARANEEIAIRDEPAPVPGDDVPDAALQPEESFDVLFRSDGELAQPDTAGDLDINLDSDVEPAALDDAVDSRLLTFVQQADRAERWRRPWVRATLALAALLLIVVLAAQLLVAQRDSVVAQWPGTRALVQSLCAPLDCRIEPLRRIDSLGVDSSGLTRIDDGPVYRLMLVLRNRGDTVLQMPSIDLSLTDASGALVSRRVLSAADLGTPRTTIAAGQELPLQALLMSPERPLAGYTIEIFYP